MKQEYRDRNQMPFDDIYKSLSPRISNWPTPKRVKVDHDNAMAAFHEQFAGTVCWFCETHVGAELHHLGAGTKGRSHERSLFCWSCPTCHRDRVRQQDLARWLHGKWKFDKAGTDWLWLTLRLGYFPPDIKLGRSQR